MVDTVTLLVISPPPFVISLPPFVISSVVERSLHALRLVEMTWGLRLIVGYVVIVAAATAGVSTS